MFACAAFAAVPETWEQYVKSGIPAGRLFLGPKNPQESKGKQKKTGFGVAPGHFSRLIGVGLEERGGVDRTPRWIDSYQDDFRLTQV